MILVSIVNIYFIIPTVAMGLLMYGFRFVYVSASRNVKRVESIARSPIYAHTNSTLQGLTTIRAFSADQSVRENFNTYLNFHTSVSQNFIVSKSQNSFNFLLILGLLHVHIVNQMFCVLARFCLRYLHCCNYLRFSSNGCF